jgi:hypothetical protein
MNPKVKIYSFYYKKTTIPIEDDLYCPVMAGNALNPDQTGMRGDDTGISISEKNPWYSELTGIFWVWKNTKQDFTGCCHYRRYFTARNEPADLKLKRLLYFPAGLFRKRYGLIYTRNLKRFKEKILNTKEILEIFQDYDAILPQKRKLNYSVKKHYERYHNPHDLNILEEILKEKYPSYVPSFYRVLDGNRLYANNMFVLPEAHLQRFLSWWFSILFEFEKRMNPGDYSGYQQRIFGFLGERMLTVWFSHENLKIKELPLIYFKKIKN